MSEQKSKCTVDLSDTGTFRNGVKLERLGKLLQEPRSSIKEIAIAAHDAGLDLRFTISEGVVGDDR